MIVHVRNLLKKLCTFASFILFQSKTLREKCPCLEFSGPYFLAFGLNTDTQNTDTFHAEKYLWGYVTVTKT